MTYTIRPATPTDALHIITLVNAIAQEGEWLATDSYEPTLQWQSVLYTPAREPRALLLIAEAGTEILAWLRIFPYSMGSRSRHVGDVGIGVAKSVRRRGIGRALLHKGMALAKQLQYEKLMLEVYASNLPARGLFTASGFEICGKLTRHAKWNDRYVDQLVMERLI